MNVGVVIFDDVDLLDFAGPYEVYTSANEILENSFHVFTIGVGKKTILTANGLSVNSDFLLDKHPEIDILVLPGGIGSKREMNNNILSSWILKQYQSIKLLYSVCTGFRLLKNTALLNGKDSTTHHLHYDELRKLIPDTNVLENVRFTNNEKLMTSAGITAGIDLALHSIKIFKSNDLAEQTKLFMEY